MNRLVLLTKAELHHNIKLVGMKRNCIVPRGRIAKCKEMKETLGQ